MYSIFCRHACVQSQQLQACTGRLRSRCCGACQATSTAPTLHLRCTYDTAPTLHLPCTYPASTLHLRCTYTATTLHLHCTYPAHTLHIHCTYTAPTLQQHCTYTAPTPHLHCTYPAPPACVPPLKRAVQVQVTKRGLAPGAVVKPLLCHGLHQDRTLLVDNDHDLTLYACYILRPPRRHVSGESVSESVSQ